MTGQGFVWHADTDAVVDDAFVLPGTAVRAADVAREIPSVLPVRHRRRVSTARVVLVVVSAALLVEAALVAGMVAGFEALRGVL